ncbi:hypothetical protein MNBD_ALPHA09-1648 [hydrothermal vent metagenome]|uniref:Uncharacterized protein n=1 Tax=hydrothermal vent metagenome TaxID=652676 RepID=A0A3B0TJ02_9ZZZZ
MLPIASRSISTIIKNQGISDLYKIHSETSRNKIDFNLAAIAPEFAGKSREPFDREYMSALFNSAHNLAQAGYAWLKAPPGLGSVRN